MHYKGSAYFLSSVIAKGNSSLEPSTALICGSIIMPRKHKHVSEMQSWLKIHGYSVDVSWRHMAFDCLAFSVLTGSLWGCIIDEKTHFILLNMWALCAFLSPFYNPSHSLLWYWTLQLSPDQLYFQFYHWVISTALVTYFTEIKTYFYSAMKKGSCYLPFLLEKSLQSPLSFRVLVFAQKINYLYFIWSILIYNICMSHLSVAKIFCCFHNKRSWNSIVIVNTDLININYIHI